MSCIIHVPEYTLSGTRKQSHYCDTNEKKNIIIITIAVVIVFLFIAVVIVSSSY